MIDNVDKDNKFIKLIELGNTWQGEGPYTGRQMVLARFKKCNRQCPFCDTNVKMRTAYEGFFSINDINKALEKTRGLMITGGEPTLEDNYNQAISMIENCDYEICNVETNGYNLLKMIKDTEDNCDVKFIYSPKIFNEIDYEEALNLLKPVLDDDRIYFKIVITNSEKLKNYVVELSKRCISKSRIYLMAQGLTKEEITQNWDRCIEMADKYNCNLSSRMHIVHGFI